MCDSLQGLLEELHEVKRKTHNGRGIEASNLVKDVTSQCQELVTASDLEYGTSLLFNENYGVLEFIRVTISLKEFETSKADLLAFLVTYLEVIGDHILQYARSIKETCVAVLNRDTSSKVKIESLNLLIKILTSKNRSVREKLDVPSLAERLFSLCLQSAKQSPSGVRGAIFYSLGVIAQEFPEHMTGKADRLSSIFLGTLRQQMTSVKKPDFLVLAGCLRGLTGYLVSFSKPIEGDSNYATELFGFIKIAIDPKIEFARYEIRKAALCLLEKHSFHFRELVTNDHQYMYDVLSTWSKHSNKEMRVSGLRALDSCLYQISKCIVGRGKNAQTMSIFKGFMKDFHKVLNSESANIKDLSMAVKGFGVFAEACKMLLDEEDLKVIFEEILNRSQHIFSRIEILMEETIQNLPTFLDSLSKILQQLNEVTSVNLVAIERIVIILFESYPKLGKGGMRMYEKGLAHFIRVISLNPSVFRSCLSQIVYQGLIRTCSHPVITDEGLSEEDDTMINESKISHQSYTFLWIALLTAKSYRDQNVLDDLAQASIVRDYVYDELIQSIAVITKKLNFGTLNTSQVEPESQHLSESTTMASTPAAYDVYDSMINKDLQIFINLVDFCRSILLECEVAPFFRWIPFFIKEMIILSSRYPIVSGFYKLLEISARLCRKLKYFENVSKEDTIPSDAGVTYLLLNRYMTDVLGRIKQFKDELLFSCLQFLLNLPVECVEEKVACFIKPVKMALKLGLSNNVLAISTLDALKRWKSGISSTKMSPLISEILPSFDRYLQTASNNSGIGEHDDKDTIILGYSSNARRNRVPIKLLKALRDSEKETMSPLMQLRYCIVKFLGDLGGSINKELVKGGRTPDLSNAVTWDTAKHLSFALPFCDMKPTIYLDPFLPRVIELATTSSNRQTKVVACELLHALTLFVLGKNTQQTNQSAKLEGIKEIYKRLFPALLKLASDTEQVAEQLFGPLVFQVIHWVTCKPSKAESPDTMILLDAIFEGLVNQNNNALREFSAKCIREFFEWSIKQSSSEELSKTAINPKAVFKRIYNLANHPNVYKRLGASSAFNSLYTVFREHEPTVDIYVLELLTVFLESLAIAHDDEPVIGTIDHCKEAINHLERIIKQKSKLLFKRNKYRRTPWVLRTVMPSEFTIDHMFVWLLSQCGSPKTECRHKSMDLLYKLLPTQFGISHARIWFENTLKSDGSDFFIDRFEAHGNGSSKLLPHLGKQGSLLRLKDLVSWYERYLAALDCYTWISNAHLVKPDAMLNSPSSAMLECVNFFLKELAVPNLESIMVKFFRFGMRNSSQNITPRDKEVYNRSKCTAIVRTLDFLTATLVLGMWRNDVFAGQRKQIFSEDCYLLVRECLFYPGSVGFNITEIEVLENLPEQLCSFCMGMKKGLPSVDVESFFTYLTSSLSNPRYDLAVHLPIDLKGNMLDGQRKCFEVQQLVSGYELLNKTGILCYCKVQKELASLSSTLFSEVLNGILPLYISDDLGFIPSQICLAESMLRLALHLDSENYSIVQILLDQKPIEDHRDKKQLTSKGSMFCQLFSTTINGFLMESDGSIISRIIRFKPSNPDQIAGTLQKITSFAVKQYPKLDGRGKSRIDSIIETIVKEWTIFCSLWKSDASIEAKTTIWNLLRGLILINAKVTLHSSGLNAAPTFATYLQLITDAKTGLHFKTQLFEVLPIVGDGLDENQRSILSKTLKRLIAEKFPICSADLMVGTTRHSEHSNCLQQLFKSLAMSSSHILLDVLLTVILKETEDVYENFILPSLRMFSKRLSSNEAGKSLDLCFNVVFDQEHHPNDVRKGVTNRILMVMLREVESRIVKLSFVNNIKVIVQTIENKLAKHVESAFENQLVTKICCYKLIQSLYVIFSKDELTAKHSDIIRASFPFAETGKELTQAITKAAHIAKSEDCRGETLFVDLRREYHCSAYNALCAVIACTQTEQKFYSGFLFTENKIKGQMLWDNIINVDKKFTFEAEQNVPFARKKQLQMIRKMHESAPDENDFMTRGFLPYLSSQYLMDSSLSEDLSQFDFSTPVQAYSSSTNPEFLRSQLSRGTKKPSEEIKEENAPFPEEVLEMDEVNKNDCMVVLVSLLKHMRDSNVYNHPAEGKEGHEMPTWMNCLFRAMNANETALNVKIFFLKLIINLPKIFEPFGKFWFKPIVQLIISEQVPGDRLSYFLVDAIVVMLSWSNSCIPEDSVIGRNVASGLLDYLIKNCHHNNRAVLKNNLQVIKTLTRVWKDRLEINYKLVYDKLSYQDRNTKDNMTGIQILGVLLSNGFEPYCYATGLQEEKYYSALTQNLLFKYKEVFASAAEVTGLVMKYITNHADSLECPIFMQTYEKLVQLNSTNVEKFVMCLHRIQLNYSAIVDRFIVQLLYILPSIHGLLKQLCLETLASRADSFEEPRNIFKEIKTVGLDASINHRDEGVQLAAVNLFNGLLKHLTADELLPLLRSIAKLRNQSSVALRGKMYEIFMWIYDIYRADDHMECEESIEILKLSKEALLIGISDKSTEISLSVLNFWRHETRLPNSTLERFIEILRALYSTRTEKEYLCYFTNLLLQLTSMSPDYSLPLFTEPLDSSKRFEEYHVNSSWQRQKIAMTPLFAATQIQSQPSAMGSSLSTGMLRATQQSLQFTPTQQETRSSENWMNPTLQAGSKESLSCQTMPSQSSVLFSFMESEKKGFNEGILSTANVSQSPSESGNTDERNEILRLKRRIWKSKEKTDSYFAMKEKRLQQLRQVEAKRQKAAMDHKVVMYRKYRVGELPDIQIKCSELIVPLQAAAQCDSIISRQLFTMLFDALVKELPDKFSEDTMEKARADIQEAIASMMQDSITFFPPFVYALEDACFRSSHLKLDAKAVTIASKTSVQLPVGIILLEKQLLNQCFKELPAKRRCTKVNQSDDFSTWIELAKLYKAVDKYDFVHAIFGSEITKQQSTRYALESEERNDYSNALKFYNQLASTDEWRVNEPTREEEEFWDIARLMCYDNLAKWSNLRSLTLQSIDDDSPSDIGKIWEDAYLQEQFLPYYMRSNLKLICHGASEVDAEQFEAFIDDGLRIEERKEILESKFCDELALLRILQDNFGAAKHYIHLGIRRFCDEWSSLNSLMKESKLVVVSRLQMLYEMKEFTELVSTEENFSVVGVKGLLRNWAIRQLDENCNSISVWDDLIINRCTYLKKIKRKLKEINCSTSDDLDEMIDTEQAKYLLKIAEVARKQGNYSLASRYLRESYDSTMKEQALENGLSLNWYHVYANVNRYKARKLRISEAVPTLVTVLEQLHTMDTIAKKQLVWEVEHALHKSATFDCIVDMIYDAEILDFNAVIGNKEKVVIQTFYGSVPQMQKDAFLGFANQCSYNYLNSAVTLSNRLSEDLPENRNVIEKTLMKMVNFCDKHLKDSEENETGVAQESEYADIIVRYMIKALTLDSKDARLRFPRLLQILDRYPETTPAFANKVVQVPTWMFLAWLNQIVAQVDKADADAIFPILSNIAKEYPQALIHPLRISSDRFSFPDSPQGKHKKNEIARLLDIINNPMCNEFIEALDQLSNPKSILKDWSGEMLKLLQIKRRDLNQIRRCFAFVWKRLFEPVERHDRIRGEVRRRCSKELLKSVENYFDKDGSKIVDMPVKDFKAKFGKLAKELEKIERTAYNLKDYSPWFSTFHRIRRDTFIEVPGQYTGNQKPLPEYHVHIAGFDERVLVLNSLRQPKRITIRGHNEKEYLFLVKGGEDLRLDQRIEQVFEIMNGILAKDATCSSKALRLKTYQVIPLTTRIGIIEWMNNTVSFGDFVKGVYTEEERDFVKKSPPFLKYKQFISRYGSNGSDPKTLFRSLFKNASRTEVVTSFEQIQAMIPWDLLRRAFDRLSASTEAYFVLRNHFILSHSCLCICQYILGIGDRHPFNLMVSKTNGGMIGIDFGYSFGVSTIMLPVPELMPFRLTRQFRNLLLPLKDLGPYRIPMTDVLRALRLDSDLLLNTMDVFVHEPLIDWEVNAQNQTAKLDNEDTSANWYPKEKISICKQKLKGVNCAFITGEELRLRCGKSSALKDLQAVAFGNFQYNTRMKKLEEAKNHGGSSKYYLQPEEQAVCLIDQATDLNLLGRTYWGWEPFL